MASKKTSQKKVTKKSTAKKGTPQKGTKENTQWFRTGAAGKKHGEAIDSAAKSRQDKAVSRFWLVEDEEAAVVLIENKIAIGGFYYSEHKFWNGKWEDFFTCVKDFRACEVCENRSDNYASLVIGYTAIDTRTIERKDGKKLKNRKVLLPFKGKTPRKQLEKLKEKYKGNLHGLVVTMSRSSNDDPKCGMITGVKGRLKPADIVKKFGKEALKPIDFLKVLAPPTEAELAAYGISAGGVAGSEGDLSGGFNEEEFSDGL